MCVVLLDLDRTKTEPTAKDMHAQKQQAPVPPLTTNRTRQRSTFATCHSLVRPTPSTPTHAKSSTLTGPACAPKSLRSQSADLKTRMAQANMRPMLSLPRIVSKANKPDNDIYGKNIKEDLPRTHDNSDNYHDANFEEKKCETQCTINILEDFVLLRLRAMFSNDLSLLADLLGRSKETIKVRLRRLVWLDEKGKNKLEESAIMIGRLGVGIHVNTFGGLVRYRRINDPNPFTFNARLLKFQILHKLFEKLGLEYFGDPFCLISKRPNSSQCAHSYHYEKLSQTAKKINPSDKMAIRHAVYRLNHFRIQKKHNCPPEACQILMMISKIYECSFSKLYLLIVSYNERLLGDHLLGFVHAAKVI
jgi:hypothetical protein